MQLNDLDFADDLILLPHTQQKMQEKMTSVAATSAAIAFNIHEGKSKILLYNTTCTNQITRDGETLEDVKTFTYMGRIIDEHSGSDADAKLSTQNTFDPLARHYQQQPIVRENKLNSSGGRNQEEALEVDKAHLEESTQLRHEASPYVKSLRPKEKIKTEEHITPRNGDRYEENEQKLDRTRKETPGKNELENTGRWPMLD
ncbi:unnamed protein product [Schistosoma mattheei]|uniref:Uncharacterized protein n=1 Tax=Schistosoma mattheei TaxID=31246 RepID=A0A183PNI5_9TREM|nr:unnamed protein product [Schistosoma mattheei]